MLNKHVPTKLSNSRHDQLWLTTELKRKCHKKQSLYNKWKKLKARNKPWATTREEYKKLHYNTSHLPTTEGMDEIHQQHPIWRPGRKVQQTILALSQVTAYRSIRNRLGQVHSDPLKKASIFTHQFKSMFAINDEVSANTHLHGPSLPPRPDVTIIELGVKKLLKRVDPRKVSGPHEVPCCMLQELHEELAPVFTALFRNSYESGSLPEVWKSAWISPVFKSGNKCNAANYRPVSLICIACKLLEHILCSHIRNHLNMYNALSSYQHGFKKRLSCEPNSLWWCITCCQDWDIWTKWTWAYWTSLVSR